MEDIAAPDTPQDAEAPHFVGTPQQGTPIAESPKPEGDHVVLRTVYPTDEFEHGVKGVPKAASVITASGTEVTPSHAEKIKKAAAQADGVSVEEIR